MFAMRRLGDMKLNDASSSKLLKRFKASFVAKGFDDPLRGLESAALKKVSKSTKRS